MKNLEEIKNLSTPSIKIDFILKSIFNEQKNFTERMKLSPFKTMEIDDNLVDIVDGILGFDVYIIKYEMKNELFVNEAIKNLLLYLRNSNSDNFSKIKRYAHYLNEL